MIQPIYRATLAIPVSGVEVIFDDRNPHFNSHQASHNDFFLTTVKLEFDTMLRVRGHVFLNEVLDALGFERTAYGAIAGWHHLSAQNFVHFDVDFVNPGGYGSIDMNVRFVGVEPIISRFLE